MFVHKFKDGSTLILPEEPYKSKNTAMLCGYIPENKYDGEGLVFGSEEDLLSILVNNIAQLNAMFGPKGKKLLAITLSTSLEQVAKGTDGVKVMTITKYKEVDDAEGCDKQSDV
jgi:hypothetical protein